MHDPKPGQLVGPEEKRDAIHVAICPVTASEHLLPGARVGFVTDDSEQVSTHAKEIIGVIDPYLTQVVNPGDRCWMFLFPGTITSLRHEWTHPAFESVAGKYATPAQVIDAKQWLQNFIKKWDFKVSVGEMIEGASNPAPDGWGTYFTAHEIDFHSAGELGDDYEKFWQCIEVCTGKHFDEAHKEKVGWSCSC